MQHAELGRPTMRNTYESPAAGDSSVRVRFSSMAAKHARAPERAQLRLIGYPSVDRARPVNQRVQRLIARLSASFDLTQ